MPKKIKIKIKAEDLRRKLKIENGKDGYTPKKGVDYFDGEKGESGNDGITPDTNKIVLEASNMALVELESKIPTIPAILELLPMEGEKVRDALEVLTWDERLDKSAVKGLEDYNEISRLAKLPKNGVTYGGSQTFYGLQ